MPQASVPQYRDAELARLHALWGPLSRRTIRALQRADVPPERLPTMTDWQLRRVNGVGARALREIRKLYPAPAAAAQRSA